jgi:hypothetical protein
LYLINKVLQIIEQKRLYFLLYFFGIFPLAKNFYKKFSFRDFEIIDGCSGIRDAAPTDMKEG